MEHENYVFLLLFLIIATSLTQVLWTTISATLISRPALEQLSQSNKQLTEALAAKRVY